jgi:hypothetical protein
MDAPVCGRRGKVDGGVRGPGDGKDVVCVGFEGVEFERKLADVPQAYCLEGQRGRSAGAVKHTLSLEPVMRRYSLLGAKATALTSAECPSTCELGLAEFSLLVSHLPVSSAGIRGLTIRTS